MPEITEGPTPSPSPTATPALEPKRLTIAAAGTIYAPKTVRESVQEGMDHYDPATRRASPGTLEIVPLYIARQREDSGIVYRVVDAENEQAIQSLTTTEQAAAAQAVERVKNATQEE